ncbi:MAG: aspartate/glutamate racemase family protein [Reyranella sp.]|uniref:aspartate/glutamate racemase family protein n=1 Tax=Reyranella sp. TaxID=1929291 RepID=UPI001AC7BB39|nr:aspartate/glutamate racemase family protein [Reyranella sp.]MBN9090444.1 aspartate/glutamate racemase family protein [Reyranella sp.]
MSAVGIVGGLGVGATVHYYEKIAAACKARGVVPDLVIAHADVDHGQQLIRDGKLGALAKYLAGFIERLARAGAETAVLPAVTPHLCIRELSPLLPIPLLNIVEILAAELVRRRIKRVALMGSIFTVQGSLWGQLAGIEIAKPQPDEIAFIGAAYQRILDGRTEPGDADGLRRIATELRERDGAETILLAGTDLAVMFDEASAGFPCLDVARLHIDAIVETLARPT